MPVSGIFSWSICMRTPTLSPFKASTLRLAYGSYSAVLTHLHPPTSFCCCQYWVYDESPFPMKTSADTKWGTFLRAPQPKEDGRRHPKQA